MTVPFRNTFRRGPSQAGQQKTCSNERTERGNKKIDARWNDGPVQVPGRHRHLRDPGLCWPGWCSTTARPSTRACSRGPAVASGGGGWAVLLIGDKPDGADIHMVRVQRRRRGTTKVPSALSAQVDPLVTVGDGQSLVLWAENQARMGGGSTPRVGDDGRPLDGAWLPRRARGRRAERLVVAFDGTLYLVVQRTRSGPSTGSSWRQGQPGRRRRSIPAASSSTTTPRGRWARRASPSTA